MVLKEFIVIFLGYVYAATDDYDINWTLPQCVLVLRLIGKSKTTELFRELMIY